MRIKEAPSIFRALAKANADTMADQYYAWLMYQRGIRIFSRVKRQVEKVPLLFLLF